MRRHFASYLLALSFLPSVTSKGLAETDGLTTIDFPGASFTSAQGINPRGDIVGNYRIAGVLHGYRLSRGGEFRSIDFPDASSSFAREINPRGDIVGAYVSAGVFHGYLLSGGEFASIDFPGASSSLAQGINPRGDKLLLLPQRILVSSTFLMLG